ncbi:tRNA-specific adenosine deaminase [Comamonas serinivorans]|uniref:tRNA-specific adenosine deaminase n=1 Tax=Comamonas serinivorans TaxID=1082851 RepID=A0A1Y0ERC7_9BURK|nr:nucleoside deaminase [Comamonas serinivorans]ARU06215.1 tRNA-specific adenosine deaminase [Comamonas serinivorans]
MTAPDPDLSPTALAHLTRCIDLAEQALNSGHQPFGSLLVDGDGQVRFEDHNRVGDGDATRHPEFTLVEWAVRHLSAAERAAATVYTSGEHCPMCAAAHAWVGLGRIVYVTSAAQLGGWLRDWGVPPLPVNCRPIHDIAPGVPLTGPVPQFEARMKALYARAFRPA